MSHLHRAEKYNKNPDECRWPIDLFGHVIKNCDFGLKHIEDKKTDFGTVSIVLLPAGTSLYHGTIIGKNQKLWFLDEYPKDTRKGGAWFTSTKEHQQNINSTYVLKYVTERNMYGIFEQNLWNVTPGLTGSEYIPYFMKAKDKIKNYKIEFYAGCNECEIFILDESIKTTIKTNPIILTSPKKEDNPYKFIN